jgi:hypothetical protein
MNVFRDGTHNWNLALGRTFVPRGAAVIRSAPSSSTSSITRSMTRPTCSLCAVFGQITNTATKAARQFSLRLNF